MDRQVIDRRREPRLPATAVPPIHATLRPGHVVLVVDLSPSASRIETTRQVRPGSRVHVRLVLAGEDVAVGALVLRCAVSAIHPGAGVRYRSALQFDEGRMPFWEAAWISVVSPRDQRGRHVSLESLPSAPDGKQSVVLRSHYA